MKLISFISMIFIFNNSFADQNVTPYNDIFDTLKFEVKYCEKYVIATYSIKQSDIVSGIIVSMKSLFSNNNYLKKTMFRSSMSEGIMMFEPYNIENCGKKIRTEDYFYIKYQNDKYLKNDGNGSFYLDNIKNYDLNYNLNHNSSLFFLRSLNIYLPIEENSYILMQDLVNKVQILECDATSLCYPKNQISEFFIRLIPVANFSKYGKAQFLNEKFNMKAVK
ncbi:hypothetical protein [Silvanigrella aquatica]|uniref:Uncharacterized protein n=1 Tax=Silvanigrella aquatica TaxID=1915309 RepID=A0A1L4D044_9BACT|nr:hypothetical protein [Silvanigrella aquatica]APJ03569.1 hypothetical protein AXG55_06465 [Silvanigrella aquatica]